MAPESCDARSTRTRTRTRNSECARDRGAVRRSALHMIRDCEPHRGRRAVYRRLAILNPHYRPAAECKSAECRVRRHRANSNYSQPRRRSVLSNSEITIDSPRRPLPLPLALETANDRNRGAKERERALNNNNKPVPRILRASTRAPSRATGTNAFGAGARVGTAGAAVGGRRANAVAQKQTVRSRRSAASPLITRTSKGKAVNGLFRHTHTER